ncbi:MAG: hypothetical protein LLG05_07850 [Porphyromonadaceae bacterium]|nr:hypothetical protein [Porphyromonadaceae bacterium]
MTADEFVDTMDALKEFLEERGESALGDRFVEMYVNVVEMAVGDCARMVTWFVCESEKRDIMHFVNELRIISGTCISGQGLNFLKRLSTINKK